MKESGNPLVSVVVPVYNRLPLLRETVASLEAQTLRQCEFVLVDDRSNEETAAFLGKLPGRDPRFRIIVKPESLARGCQVSRNLGMDAARGEAIVFLDSDDLLAPTCLKERSDFLKIHPLADLVIGNQAVLLVAENSSRWVNLPRPDTSDLDRFLSLANPVDVPWVNAGCLIRTDRLREAGVRWRPEFLWDDAVFHFECLLRGLVAEWMPRSGSPDALYRLHGIEQFGQTLHSREGENNTRAMLAWMTKTLRESGKLTQGRLHRIARSWFHLCILTQIDAGNHEAALASIRCGSEAGLFSETQVRKLLQYTKGRRFLRSSTRLTYFWNRFARNRTLQTFFPKGITESYNQISVDPSTA